MSCGHPSCAVFKDQGECCARRRRYGVIIEALFDLAHPQYDALDAFADVMRDRHALLRQHRRELFEEQRGAQRDATAAYHEGHRKGYSEGRGGDEW